MINIYEPEISKYKNSAIYAIESGWISNHGEFVSKSTDRLKKILNIKHAILMANGTCATHCLFLALKYKYPIIKKIYVPNNCYVAAWNSVLMEYDKKYIEVMKMDLNTWNISVDEDYIKSLDANAAVLIVHNLGNIINVPKLKQIRPDLIFIEDNCEGFSGKYEGIYSGTSVSSLCSSVSFYGNKIITTGEGGAFLTNDDDVYNYILKVYSQGMSQTRYLHDIHAYNYRMTNIQAAFLYDQLNDFEAIIKNKKQIFDNYKQLLDPLIKSNLVRIFNEETNTDCANWIFGLRLINNNKNITETMEYFKKMNIDIRPFFYPINSHEHLKEILFEDDNSFILNREVIMIPSSPTITFETQQYIVKIINLFTNNINIIEITNDNKELLEKFTKNKLPDTFRYFNSRPLSVINDHLITLLMLKNNEPIGYAHVDFCKNTQKKWFGICLIPNYQMQGFGSIMINFILNNKKVKNTDNLFLTVDVNNKYAIKLYEKYNFKIIEENDKFFTMKLPLSN